MGDRRDLSDFVKQCKVSPLENLKIPRVDSGDIPIRDGENATRLPMPNAANQKAADAPTCVRPAHPQP